jgi:alkylation response protein AidB-like acyl-CoA dehydrogenase
VTITTPDSILIDGTQLEARPAAAAPDRPSPLSGDLLTAARRVAATARDHAAEGERACSLAPAVVDALVASGLPRLLAPTALGGLAAHPATLVDVIATIAAGDPSAGWVAAIGLGANHFSGYVAQSAACELYTDLSRTGCGAFAPSARGVTTPDGYRVTGRWPFASGCQHAAVQTSGMIVCDERGTPVIGVDGMPVQRLAVIPTDRLRILETWDTVGLRGTGSHDTVAEDLLVPHEHTIGFATDPWPGDPLFRLPLFSVLAPCLASAALGTARAALDGLEEQAREAAVAPPRPGPRPRFADDPFSQRDLGRAEVRLRSAHSFLIDLLDRNDQCVRAGDEIPRVETALVGLTCGEAMRAAAHAIDVACRISGSASVRTGSPLERARRDIDTMRKHVLFSPGVEQPLGRQAAGIPTVAFPFLLPPR